MRQAGYILLLLWGVATVVFFLFYVIPGDPAQMMLGQRDDEEQRLAINAKYGFNLPLGTQYVYFLNDLSPVSIHHSKSGHISSMEPDKYTGLVWNVGDSWNVMLKWPYLRTSFQQRGASVSTLIAQVLPNTAILAGTSIFIAFIVGLLFGTISALFPNTIWDRSLATISTLGMSLPSFFSAILMAWLFGFVWSSWTPVTVEVVGSNPIRVAKTGRVTKSLVTMDHKNSWNAPPQPLFYDEPKIFLETLDTFYILL